MTTAYNIAIRRGDDWKRKFRFRTTAVDVEPAEYLDVDDPAWSGIAQVRLTEDAGTVLCEAVITFGTDATSAWCQVHFIASETAGLSANAKWDLELTGPDGVWTPLGGDVVVSKDVSKVP